MNCIYCQGTTLIREPSFSDFRTITSDVKPWRRGLNIAVCRDCGFPQAEVTDEWQKSASEIYSDYASYYQTSDNDQTVFIDGAASGRGDLFVDSVVQTSKTRHGGAVLDFGCGEGHVVVKASATAARSIGFDIVKTGVHDWEKSGKYLLTRNFDKVINSGPYDIILLYDVLDHCEALEILLNKGEAGGVYNIGCDNERSNMEVTKMILKIMGKGDEMIEYVTDRPGHDRRYAIDASKILALGWEPKYTQDKFEQGLKETVEWYLSNKDWVEKLWHKKEDMNKFQENLTTRSDKPQERSK